MPNSTMTANCPAKHDRLGLLARMPKWIQTGFLAAIALLLGPLLSPAAQPAERPNTVLVHPGEVLYARFEEAGMSLKLLSVSKENNDQAQLAFTMDAFDKKNGIRLKVVSKFKKEMTYKAEMRLLNANRRQDTSVVPVMAGLSSYESWPQPFDELALYGFELKP